MAQGWQKWIEPLLPKKGADRIERPGRAHAFAFMAQAVLTRVPTVGRG